MVEHSVESIASHLQGQLIGDGKTRILGINSLEAVQAGELTFAEDSRRLAQALNTRASAVIVPAEVKELDGRAGIRVSNPRLAFARSLDLFYPLAASAKGVHPTAIIGGYVSLGKDVSIRAHAVIGDHASIGDGTTIGSGVHVGEASVIGSQCFIAPNVVIYPKSIIGNRVRIHGGTVIGSDGFGYVLHQGQYVKVPQVGNVVIEDDVELGANVCVDRATVGSTLIRRGTKIDNLVQIAHNDRIGQHVIMAGQVGLAGSVTVGDYTVMGGQAGAVDHVTIGSRVQVGAATPVTRSVPDGETIWGFPGRPIKESKEHFAMIGRIPALLERVKQLISRVEALEKRSAKPKPKRKR